MLTAIFGHRRKAVLSVAIAISLIGAIQYATMPRQEDPFFPYRAGLLTSTVPGATAEVIEQEVLRPLEEHLANVEEIDHTESVARHGLALINIQLQDSIYETDRAWERVRAAVANAALELPSSATPPLIDDRVVATPVATYAVSGDVSELELLDHAERLRDHILKLPSISFVKIVGAPEKEVRVSLDDDKVQGLGLTTAEVASQLGPQIARLPHGDVIVDGLTIPISGRKLGEGVTLFDRSLLKVGEHGYIPLDAVGQVSVAPSEPVSAAAWIDGRRSILVDVYAVPNQLNIEVFGEALAEHAHRFAGVNSAISVEPIFFQPDNVRARLDNLSGSLLLSIAIVLSVLVLTMGWRVGLTVATTLPMVTCAAIAVWASLDGVLHQMAVIGLVVSLGVLVDNAIVVVEAIQSHIDSGLGRIEAAISAVRELAGPLAAATGTSAAGFVPLILFVGPTADFTGAVPRVVVLSLVLSYFYAVLVVPGIATILLRQNRGSNDSLFNVLAEKVAALSTRESWLNIIVGFLLATVSIACFALVDKQFFPFADRDIVTVDIKFPEGTAIERTHEGSRRLELAARRSLGLESTNRFVGGSGSKFYYNLRTMPSEPHRARIVVKTGDASKNAEVIQWFSSHARQILPSATIVPFQLQQGPPVNAPVEIRIQAQSRQALIQPTLDLTKAIRAIPGTLNVRHSLGTGSLTLSVIPDEGSSNHYGITHDQIATATTGMTNGHVIGTIKIKDDNVPVRVVSDRGKRTLPADILGTSIRAADGEHIPLSSVSRVHYEHKPSAIEHYNQDPVAYVSSELAAGYSYGNIDEELRQLLESMDIPADVSIQLGGEAEASGKASVALTKAAPAGVILLLFFLLIQFSSFRRVIIILLTIPFTAVGVVPGLLLSGSAFGFQSLQGVIALSGIVVNTAIIIIAVVGQNMDKQMDVVTATREAVARRLRPILLAAGTTILSLLPLALSESTLWPPMAWAMISGLVTSTILSLIVLPRLLVLAIGGIHRRVAPAI